LELVILAVGRSFRIGARIPFNLLKYLATLLGGHG